MNSEEELSFVRRMMESDELQSSLLFLQMCTYLLTYCMLHLFTLVNIKKIITHYNAIDTVLFLLKLVL